MGSRAIGCLTKIRLGPVQPCSQTLTDTNCSRVLWCTRVLTMTTATNAFCARVPSPWIYLYPYGPVRNAMAQGIQIRRRTSRNKFKPSPSRHEILPWTTRLPRQRVDCRPMETTRGWCRWALANRCHGQSWPANTTLHRKPSQHSQNSKE